MSWLRPHRPTTGRLASAGTGSVGDAERRACIGALVLMLVADQLSEDEFDVRWKSALEARTHAELDALRYDPDGGGDPGGEDLGGEGSSGGDPDGA